ncbi:MAG: hypothetical protein RL628_1853 [Actinomycetota bacterium]
MYLVRSAAAAIMTSGEAIVIPQTIEVFQQLQVAVQRQRRVDPRLVHRRHEDSEAKTHVKLLTHTASLNRAVRTHCAS